MQQQRSVTVILFLGANPSNATHLRLDQEVRAIDQAVRQAEYRDRFDLPQHWAARASDLQELLQRHQPHIVHFSGHGNEAGQLILEDDSGREFAVPPDALSRLFAILRDNLRCVVLNACYSETQAQAIAEHIDCVVGMPDAIGDAASISFASSFYQALANGRDVQTAFDLGCNSIDLQASDEPSKPKLLAQRCDPRTVVFVPSSQVPVPPRKPGLGQWFGGLPKTGKAAIVVAFCLLLAAVVCAAIKCIPPPALIALQTDHARYVTALKDNDEQGRDWLLWADAPEVSHWERFTLECLEDGTTALRTHEGRYVTATGEDSDWILKGDAEQIGDFEKFTLRDTDTNKQLLCSDVSKQVRQKPVELAIWSARGWYVTAVDGQSDGRWILRGKAPSIGAWEQFTVVKPP